MQDRDYFDYIDDNADEMQGVPDSYFLEAKNEFEELFDKDRKAVFYMRQLQIKYEKKYFHWVAGNAITALVKEGFLKQVNMQVNVSGGNKLILHFFAHHANRYIKRDANALAKIVAEYSQEHITRSCGNRAEVLFAEGLASRQFVITGKNVAEYCNKKWVKTEHNLDYIFERDGIAYGCEIKNKLGYIDREELEIKLDICEYLGVRPLFIMRFSPKTYNEMIYRAGGFALLFVAQIYDLSQQELVEKMKVKLGYEVVCPRAIPDGIIDRFIRWHERHKNT